MGRRSARDRKALQTKKAIAARLQGIVETHFGTLSAFRKRHPSLASTVKNWLPGQERWKKKPNGGDMSDGEWKRVSVPGGAALIELCDLLEVRTDYVLFGDGAAYRSQERDSATLAQDVAAHVARELRLKLSPSEPAPEDGRPRTWAADVVQADVVNGQEVLRQAVELASGEALDWWNWEADSSKAMRVSTMLALAYNSMPAPARYLLTQDDTAITILAREPQVSRYLNRSKIRERVTSRLQDASDREVKKWRAAGAVRHRAGSRSG